MRVDIYAQTNIKGIRKSSGAFLWLIETQSAKGPATLNGKKSVLNVTGRIAELMALTCALERLTKPCEIMLHVNNPNLAKTLDQGWFSAWVESGFIDCKGEEIKDADKWRHFHELLKIHTLIGITSERHTYSSWMAMELGMEDEPKKNTYCDKIMQAAEIIESIDLSEAAGVKDAENAINTLCAAFYEKFKPTNSGFVKIESSGSGIKQYTSGVLTVTNSENKRDSETEEAETIL